MTRAACVALLLLSACATRTAGPVPAGSPPPAVAAPATPRPPEIVAPDAFALSGAAGQGALLYGTAPAGTAQILFDERPVRVAADGRFIIGFGRDAAPASVLEARLGDGRLLRLPLAVAPRAWDVSVLPTLQRGTSATPEYQRVRAAEVARIEAARAVDADSDGWRQTFHWPALGRISTLFGSQRIYAGGVAGDYHSGVDVARRAGGPVLEGTPARAPADGVVVLATTDHPFTLEGNLVMIDHGFGLVSALMHLSRVDVAVGEHVRQDQPIGLIGMTGRATGPHLHWGMTWRRARIDPLLLAGPMPSPE